MKRYILTGAPGAGKTTLIRRLADLGHAVVEEAATDVIADRQGAAVAEPWTEPDFVARIARVQGERRRAATAPVQFHDRSPVCTYALALHLGRPVPVELQAELDEVAAGDVFERRVFFVRNIGFVEPTAARRISFADSLAFEAVHERAYRDLGFELAEIAAASVDDRVVRILSVAGL